MKKTIIIAGVILLFIGIIGYFFNWEIASVITGDSIDQLSSIWGDPSPFPKIIQVISILSGIGGVLFIIYSIIPSLKSKS